MRVEKVYFLVVQKWLAGTKSRSVETGRRAGRGVGQTGDQTDKQSGWQAGRSPGANKRECREVDRKQSGVAPRFSAG